jgi:hypothetical protein
LNLGTYVGVGETGLLRDKLELQTATGIAGVSHKLILTEIDDTVTEFHRTTAGVWAVARTTEPEANSTTRFVRNGDGLIGWVFAPTPATSGPSPRILDTVLVDYAAVGSVAARRAS